ncbi:MAG: PAS domain S-box protein [Peptococcaceae bacterium]|nr:PAS domain S-box protein [Peptococcaceae bacterium]
MPFSEHDAIDLDKFLYLTKDLFCQTDLQGEIKWVNQAMENFLGESKEHIIGKKFLDYVHQEDRQNTLAMMRDTLHHDISPTSEIRLCLPDGNFIYYECYVCRDPERELYYFVGNDISERKEYQDKLLRLNSIVEASLDAIYAIDNDGRILSWNNAAEQIFGYNKEEIIGQTINILAFPGQEDEIDNIISIIRSGQIYSYETIRQKKDLETVAVFITLAPIKDLSGNVIGTSAVARDITRHRRLEKEIAQLDKLNTIVELASVISHEVRNPMTTVKGFLQLLYNKIKEQEFKEYFEIMIEEMDRVNSILQEFNTIGKNKKETIRSRNNLKTIINSMAPLLEADAVFQGKTIKFNLRTTPDLYVNGNEIRQLILNLTRNALESMGQNGSVVLATSSHNGKVILSVKDQGKGIDPENLEKLGTPFFSTKDAGTGLGLYVCYEIAQRNEANITVDTGPQGTTFSVIFDSVIEQ